jgi:adenylyltransferase/sulfurtransferase
VVREIDVEQLSARRSAGEPCYLLDIRQAWEHETAALPDSQLIPLDQLLARAAEVRPPLGVPLIVYCHHGIRSWTAAAMLERLGFRDVASLAGGIDAWSLRIDPNVPRY